MSVEGKSSDSSDSDILVIKQMKPVNKLTLQHALIIKYNVLNAFNSQKSKTKKKEGKIKEPSSELSKKNNKKDKIKEPSCRLNKKKSKKDKHSLAEGCDSSKKNLFYCASNINVSRGESLSNHKEILGHIEMNSKEDIEKKSKKRKKYAQTTITELVSPSKISSSSDDCDNKYIKNQDSSPEVSRKSKKLKISDSSESLTCGRNLKPLLNSFDVEEKGICYKQQESLNGSKSNHIKDEIKFKKNSCSDKLQNEHANSSWNEDYENKTVSNSELLSFLLKKIIRDETEKQITLQRQSLKNGQEIEKLLSESDCEILEKFFNLEESACKVMVRMFGRKKHWHRVSTITYKDIGENLQAEFEILHKENFVDINIENEDLKHQLDLLTKPEILKLCKGFNISCKFSNSLKKEVLVDYLIKNCTNQKSVQEMLKGKNSTTRLDLLKCEVKNYLGECIRVKEKIFQTFYKILLLFSLTHYCEEEDRRIINELNKYSQVYKNNIKFVKYNFAPTVIFEARADFEEYKESLQLFNNFLIAIEDKNHEEFICAYNKARDEFKKLLKNTQYHNRFLKLKPFLRKFSAGTVYAKVLTKYCTKFKKKADNLEIIEIAQLLISQNLFLTRKKGEWYEILAMALENQKKNNAAAEVIITSLKDPLVDEVQRLTLQLRGQSILKKKGNGINDVHLKEILDDACTLSVQVPPSIEIKGKALDRNKSGCKSVYVEEFQQGKIYTSVEQRAILYYESNGFPKGYHSEGFIIKSIYFLLFFDIIYESSPQGVFQSPYQEVPLDFNSECFYYNRKEEIDLRLSEMSSWNDEQIETKIKNVFYNNYNTICVIKWNENYTPELFCEIIKCITMPILILIFKRFIKNFRVAQSGFPDLTLWNPETKKCKFVEVKSPNDKLSPAQRIWLNYLRNIGLDCEVCNVKNFSRKSF